MIKIYKKEDCCGCYACKNICPQNCIEMKCDNEGFEYPNINNEKCINCGMCEKICPILNLDNIEKKNIKAYACKNKNNKEVEKSSSGGVFILLCKEVIKRNGVVFGATYDAEFNVVHDYSENIDECNKFMGAKYVQSKIGNTFRQVKKFLECDRTVLFSGTPCQI